MKFLLYPFFLIIPLIFNYEFIQQEKSEANIARWKSV
jgi:hypothetical protein